jgi:hypothetical protein
MVASVPSAGDSLLPMCQYSTCHQPQQQLCSLGRTDWAHHKLCLDDFIGSLLSLRRFCGPGGPETTPSSSERSIVFVPGSHASLIHLFFWIELQTQFSNQLLGYFCTFKNSCRSFGRWNTEIQSFPPSMAFFGPLKGNNLHSLCFPCSCLIFPAQT